jgi:zinc transport system substrate-binding protein
MMRILKQITRIICIIVLMLWVLPVEAAATRVFVSIAPQKYFVQKIGGDLVSVAVLVPAGADPHTYEPKPKQMAELSK